MEHGDGVESCRPRNTRDHARAPGQGAPEPLMLAAAADCNGAHAATAAMVAMRARAAAAMAAMRARAAAAAAVPLQPPKCHSATRWRWTEAAQQHWQPEAGMPA